MSFGLVCFIFLSVVISVVVVVVELKPLLVMSSETVSFSALRPFMDANSFSVVNFL